MTHDLEPISARRARRHRPPPVEDPFDAELTDEDIREALRDLLELVGPDKMAWLTLGVPNEARLGITPQEEGGRVEDTEQATEDSVER